MDIALFTTFLAPFLPYLLKLGDTASETIAAKFGEAAWTKASAIWAKLQPDVNNNEDLKIAVNQVAAKPDNSNRQAVLQDELETLLNAKPDLARAIAQLFQDGQTSIPTTQINQTVTGNQNQVIGQVSGGQVFGSITGSVVIGGNPNVSPRSQEPEKEIPSDVKTILVLAANPKDTNPLRLGEEVRKIQNGLDRSKDRDRFRIEQRWAVTPTDIRRALLDCHPQIVHFSGHGVGVETLDQRSTADRKLSVVSETNTAPEGLVFEDETGQTKLVSTEAIASLFSLFAEEIECVVLNACYSATQAEAIAQYIPYVVGMKRAIGDKAAIEFAVGFYDAVLAGEPIDFAYKMGCSSIQMEGIPEQLTPILKTKSR